MEPLVPVNAHAAGVSAHTPAACAFCLRSRYAGLIFVPDAVARRINSAKEQIAWDRKSSTETK